MIELIRKSFKGGVHPPEYKEFTSSKKIEAFPLPKKVIIPLQQHIGKPSEAIVKAGDKVEVGQPLSTSSGYVSLPSHASISGTVSAVEPYPHPLGGMILSVIIEGDGEDKSQERFTLQPDYNSLSVEELKKRIADAGIAGMGGATFPTHVKLSPPADKPIDTVILNGAECEPYLTADHRLMLEYPKEILEGLRIIMRILGVKQGIIGIEDNKPDAIAQFQQLVQSDSSIKVLSLHVKYPQGAEKQLIYTATHRSVPAGKLPMEVGCIVQNVGTAKAIYDAAAYKKPLIERVVTVTGAVQNPLNLMVRIGTPIKSLIEYCGGFAGTPAKVIVGGPMMGIAQFSLDVPVIKGTSGIVVLPEDGWQPVETQPCINCGKCIEVCPMNLMPRQLDIYVKNKLWDKAQEIGIMNCIECGSCAYVCPGGRPLVHSIRYGKYTVLQQEKASKN